MLKQAFFGVAALSMFSLNAADASAQCSCGGSGGVTSAPVVTNMPAVVESPMVGQSGTYQRFSYSPSEVAQPAIMTTSEYPLVTQPTYQSATSSGFIVSPAQSSYRRFSYQPSMSSNSGASAHKPAWSYPKTDPRRYRP